MITQNSTHRRFFRDNDDIQLSSFGAYPTEGQENFRVFYQEVVTRMPRSVHPLFSFLALHFILNPFDFLELLLEIGNVCHFILNPFGFLELLLKIRDITAYLTQLSAKNLSVISLIFADCRSSMEQSKNRHTNNMAACEESAALR